jgi:hypothetical protein
MSKVHYVKKVTTFLHQNDIEFISKYENAPNVPQARGIEKFWALCKKEYSKRKSASTSITSFQKVWEKISCEVASKSGILIMKSAKSKLRKIGYNGVDSVSP